MHVHGLLLVLSAQQQQVLCPLAAVKVVFHGGGKQLWQWWCVAHSNSKQPDRGMRRVAGCRLGPL
jgi:hypothetical protein